VVIHPSIYKDKRMKFQIGDKVNVFGRVKSISDRGGGSYNIEIEADDGNTHWFPDTFVSFRQGRPAKEDIKTTDVKGPKAK